MFTTSTFFALCFLFFVFTHLRTTTFFTSLGSNVFPIRVTLSCFLEGSKILALNQNKEEYLAIETLKRGDMIKTLSSGYKKIVHIGRMTIYNNSTEQDLRNRLYKLSLPTSELHFCEEDIGPLCVTGRHSLLYSELSEKDLAIIKKYTGDVYVTENKYRVPIFLDSRAKEYNTRKGEETVYHFALENNSITNNYGVYGNGVLVETASIEYMIDHSGMELLD